MNKFSLLMFVFICSACSYSTYYVPTGQNVYPMTEPSSIAISPQKTMQMPHKIIGRVATIVWGGGDAARESLQREAAKVGANAVIDLRLEKASWRTAASGLAVFVYEK
jgi:hypothetical protein